MNETCLVEIEPDSDFIIAEKYAQNRTGDTWNTAIDEAVRG
ncbi:hypothetical protein QUF90_03535 [Desulfococcaceae bacterium HSG9]|nr:hypothetical protein [Desulfococcaceae bacterium HSG9]